MKTLIVYATRYGSTAKTAALIAQVLTESDGREVTVLEARKTGKAALASCDNLVIGSSIAMGRWKGSAKRLAVKAGRSGKPLAIFVSAAGVLSGKEPGSDPAAPVTSSLEEREAKAIAQYIEPLVQAAGLAPVSKAAFGGRMVFFGKETLANWDGDRIRAWAKDLAPRLR